MLFFLLLIACAIPFGFLLLDFFNERKDNQEKQAALESRQKEKALREGNRVKDD